MFFSLSFPCSTSVLALYILIILSFLSTGKKIAVSCMLFSRSRNRFFALAKPNHNVFINFFFIIIIVDLNFKTRRSKEKQKINKQIKHVHHIYRMQLHDQLDFGVIFFLFCFVFMPMITYLIDAREFVAIYLTFPFFLLSFFWCNFCCWNGPESGSIAHSMNNKQ